MTIYGKNINLRTLEALDAEFIFKLRSDKDKTRFISQISGTVLDQKKWISDYKVRELNKEEFYFLIESKDSMRLGTLRLYDFKKNSFCWGSWIVLEGSPNYTAIESALLLYEFGFNRLNFLESHFDVRKKNTKVVKFHKRFGATIISEDDLDYFFRYKKEDYERIKEKYKRYL